MKRIHDVRVVLAGTRASRHWWASCVCGLPVVRRETKAEAEADAAAHVAEVAVRGADRCRDPRRHRMAPWDRCALCADQLALPGLDELDALAARPGGDLL